MQIYGPTHARGVQGINTAPHHVRSAEASQPSIASPTGDKLDISAAGELAAALASIPDIRQDRVDAIRQAIAEGTYETAEKLSMALDQLLNEIGE